jgi:hypothetical protein
MKTNELFFLLIFIVIFTKGSLSQVVWPLSPQNQQHPVVGSVGEYRTSDNRFHKGTDVSGTGQAYSINSGTVTLISNKGGEYEKIIIGNVTYYHVNSGSYIAEGSTVSIGQVIGTVNAGMAHVHIEQTDVNFFSHKLFPYVDAINPIINYAEFRRNGANKITITPLYDQTETINAINYTLLYNKVDLIVDTYDPGDGLNHRMAPITLSYHLFDNAMTPIDNWVTNFDFRTTPSNNNTTSCFYSGTLQAGVFKYILTSHPNSTAKDRYLNTCLNKNNAPQSTWPTSNTLNAPCSSESYYPDGIYNISFAVFDADYDNYTNNNNSASLIKQVLIDNFCPYISRVKIYEGSSSTPKYNRGWQWASNALLFEPQSESVKFDQNQDVKVEVITSEPMKEVKLQVGNYTAPPQTCGTNLNKTTWTFILPKASLIIGPLTLNFNGTDLADNQIQNNPSVIPIKQSDGSWVPSGTPAPYSPDTYHKFIFGNSIVDFVTDQDGWTYHRIQFSDKSTVNGTYSWNFGDNSTSHTKNPLKQYSNYGVFAVTHSVINNGTEYSITKPVSVNNLTPPVIKNIYFSPRFGNGKSTNQIVHVDFFSDCEGIIAEYSWRFIDNNTGNVIHTSNEKDPVDISLNEKQQYTAVLTVGNAADPTVYYSQLVYIDPDLYPYASILAWEVTYFVHDLEVSTANFNEDEPIEFTINFGDGITESFVEDYHTYHTFTHNYYELGEYIVMVTVKQGSNTEVRTAKRIRVQPYDLDVSINYTSLHAPSQPKEKIVCNATVVGAAGGSTFHGSWGVYRVGDPDSYHAELFQSVTQIPVFEYIPSLAGQYKIMLDVIVDGFATSGYAGQQIEVVNAPKYVESNISSDSYLLSLNSEFTLYGSVWPTGDPGVQEEDWNPTNIRWTLFDPQGNIDNVGGVIEENFPFDQYMFTHYFTHTFNKSGTYKLQLETWNKEHQYTDDDLDTSNNCRLSFYNYDIKLIEVRADLASLKVDYPPEPSYYQPDASEQTLEIIISNPSTTPINWVAEFNAGCGFVDWFEIINTSGSGLCCSNQQTISINITANPNVESRFGCIRIHGYVNGIEVQGSPAGVMIDQYGTAGPSSAIVYGEYPDLKFGFAVSIEGETAVIGSPNSSYVKGQAYIFKKNTIGIWEKKSTLLSSDDNPEFGSYVDISGDYACALGSNKVYFFRKGNPDWGGVVSEIKNYSVNSPKSVAIWGDYAVVGSPFYNGNKGEVTIYYRNEGGTDNWGLVKTIIGDGGNDFFGQSVDIYNDILVVGSPEQGSSRGFISIYNRNSLVSNDWVREQIISGQYPSDAHSGDNMKFGQSVSLFEDAISVPHYCIYNSIYGAEPQIWFPTYRKEADTWEELDLIDYLIPNNADGGNKVNSTSIFKLLDADPAIEPQYRYCSYSGFPTLGNSNSGDVAYSRYERNYLNYTYARATWDTWGGNSLETNTLYGNSLSLSYNSKIIGLPGKKNDDGFKLGAVNISKQANKANLCEAGINMSFVNFSKPSGNYSDVIAQNISMGGRTFPAIIEYGATINYEAKEIVLQDGFLADNGSVFTADAKDCGSGNSDSPHQMSYPDINLDEWPLSMETRKYLIKSYMQAFPDLPWQTLNVAEGADFEKSKETIKTPKTNNIAAGISEVSAKSKNQDIPDFPVFMLNDSKIRLKIGSSTKVNK